MPHSAPKLHNAMWPGLVGKGDGDGQEPPISLEKMLQLTAAANVNGQKFDGIDYFLFKNLFVSAGADNILSDRWRGGYAGVGLRFEDQDLKYLFGTLPRISTQ